MDKLAVGLRGCGWLLIALALTAGGGALAAAEQPAAADVQRKMSRAVELNPTLELHFEGCQPWSNGVGLDQVAVAPELQLEAARRAKLENRDYEAAEKYFQLTRRYPDAPQTIAGMLESADLLLDLGFPSQAAFCMDQVVRRAPTGTLEQFDVRINLYRRIGGAAGFGRRVDLNVTISALEATAGLTLLEANRLGYNDYTSTWWPTSYWRDPENCNPYENCQTVLFSLYHPLDLGRQFSATHWIPGRDNLRPYITDAFDAAYFAEAHLNTMLAYDPMSFNVFSGLFHRGRMRLEDENYNGALQDLGRIQVNYQEATHNRNYPTDAVEIGVFANMYTAWARLLKVPQPWKDITEDDRARLSLRAATGTINKAALLQWMPVVDALQMQLQERLATRYRRMAEFYDRNGAASAGEMMRNQLRIQAPRTVEAASTLELYPWRQSAVSSGDAPVGR